MEAVLASAGEILANYGYLVVFVWLFADQAALPLPSTPLLVAAGAVAATGELNLLAIVTLATLACLLADSLWFLLGRRGGEKAIGLICRLSLEPETCVTATRNAFGRFGPAALVIAKYLPGVQTLAPASAGFARAPWAGFLFLDAMGSLLFVVPFTVGGYLFHTELAALLGRLSEVSGGIGAAALALASIYLAVKVAQWVVFFRGHRLRRISCEALFARIASGEPVTVVDLRQKFDYELQPAIIPNALRIPIDQVAARRVEIPPTHDIVLVCT